MLLFSFLLISCEKVDFDIINLNNNKISVMGHGGMGISHTYPMNSLESIYYCLNLNSDGTEVDVEMTKDSILIAFHDLELSDRTNLSGTVYNQNWNEISSAKYTNPLYTKYRIVTLETLFSGIGDKANKLFSFDCKNFNPDTSLFYVNTFCNSLIKLIDKYNLKDNVIIELKREDIIKQLKMLRPDLRIFVYAGFEEGLILAKKYQLQGIVISVDKLLAEQVSVAHEVGLQIMVFNAHSRSRNIEAIHKNVDYIQSDNLKHLIKILK